MDADTKRIVTPLLERHEDRRKKPYQCTSGKWTIGVGRNLSDRGLSDDEIDYLFANDLRQAEADARAAIGGDGFDALTPTRRAVLIDMAFNLGLTRLLQFKNTLLAVKQGRYTDAAAGMRNSLWARQVGHRADELADMMKFG